MQCLAGATIGRRSASDGNIRKEAFLGTLEAILLGELFFFFIDHSYDLEDSSSPPLHQYFFTMTALAIDWRCEESWLWDCKRKDGTCFS